MLVGLGAVELRANPPTSIEDAGLEALAAKKARWGCDCVVGLEGAPGAADWIERFEAGQSRSV